MVGNEAGRECCEKIAYMLRSMDLCRHHHIKLFMLRGNLHKGENQIFEFMFLKIMAGVLKGESEQLLPCLDWGLANCLESDLMFWFCNPPIRNVGI